MKEIFLVRHGQAAFGTENYDRLSELGLRQCALLGRHLADCGLLPFDGIMSGTLQRHRETRAAMVLDTYSTSVAIETEALNEYDLGNIIRCWRRESSSRNGDSKPSGDFHRMAEKALLAWTRDELETVNIRWQTFRQQIERVFEDLNRSSARRILLITSGGPISVLMQRAMQLPISTMIDVNLQLANASLTRISFDARGARVVSFNSVAHLELGADPSLVTRL